MARCLDCYYFVLAVAADVRRAALDLTEAHRATPNNLNENLRIRNLDLPPDLSENETAFS
jgi:hypothetical protein